MDDDRTLRLVILPTSPSIEPMLQLLRALVSQHLVDPIPILVDAQMQTTRLGITQHDDDVQPLDRRVEEATCSRFVLINVVAADAVSGVVPDDAVPPELDLGMRVDLFVRDALAAKDRGDRPVQSIDVVNLVVPAAVPGSMSDRLHSAGPEVSANVSGWQNVLVSPEVQETSVQATVPIRPDESYVAHLAVSVISAAGCWAGADWEPTFPGYDPDSWTVMRSRSRSFIAPELPLRVLGRVGRTASRIPISDKVIFQVAPEPEHAVKLAVSELVKRRKLDKEPFADVAYRPPQRRVSLREFFRILKAWLTRRLPELVKDRIDERIRDVRNQADALINRSLKLDDDSDVVVQVFGTDEAPPPTGPTATLVSDEPKPPTWQFLQPEPGLWIDLRGTAFGMLDGGEVPLPGLQGLLGVGGQRYVLGERTWVASPPGVPMWTPPPELRRIGPGASTHAVDVPWADEWQDAFEEILATRTDQSGDGSTKDDEVAAAYEAFKAARTKARRSFLWEVGEHLHGERREILADLAQLREQLEEAKNPDEEAIDAETKKKKRRAWIRLALTIAAIAGLAAGGWWLVGALALTGIALVAAISVIALVLGFGLVKAVWRCVYSWFLADHRRAWLRKGRVQLLEAAIAFDELQLRRFEYLCFAHQEWSDIIATICFNPFRQPQPDRYRRIRSPELGLPSSHQIAEGYTAAPRLDGVVAAVASELITPGWLGITFESARSYAIEEHRIRTRGGAFEPDSDRAANDDVIGPRRALRDAILTGRARHRRELEVLRKIHISIRTGSGFLDDPTEGRRPTVDRIFTATADGKEPSRFLEESVVGEPSNFHRAFTPFNVIPTRVADDRAARAMAVDVDDLDLPDLPSTEAMIEGATVEFPPVIFTTWALERAARVPRSELAVFADPASPPTPATLDLAKAGLLWVPPPDEDRGAAKKETSVDRGSWVARPADLPSVGHQIQPTPGIEPHATRGPYRFLIEEDGEPLAHPINSPIRYAIREDCCPPGSIALLQRALQVAADRSRHTFEFVGTFRGIPQSRAERVEIGWAPDEEFAAWQALNHPGVTRSVVGWGGPNAVTVVRGGARRILSGGIVLLNADMDATPGFGSGFSQGRVLLHEIGHVLNLNHVTDDHEIMCVGSGPMADPADYGCGDSAGLRELSGLASSS